MSSPIAFKIFGFREELVLYLSFALSKFSVFYGLVSVGFLGFGSILLRLDEA